jgi:Fe-S-cluster containining protein
MNEKLLRDLEGLSKKETELKLNDSNIQQTNPLGLKKWYMEEVENINRLIDECENEIGLKNVCTSGCYHCCYQPIAILEFEAIIIKKHLEVMNNDEKKQLLRKSKEILGAIESHGISTNVSMIKSESSIHSYMKQYFKMQTPCVFLDNELKQCKIYSVRPLNCWTYRAYFTAENCKCSHDIINSIKYDDWGYKTIQKVFKVKPPKSSFHIKLLPLVVKDILEGKW